MRLVLLDRDGVINEDSPDYIRSPAQWRPIGGSIDGIVRLKRAGYQVAVCTNQAGIGRGLLEPKELADIHRLLEESLSAGGAKLDALLFCPHLPEAGCDCRKPNPGMLIEAMQRLGARGQDTLYVGDSGKDIDAARRAGCRAVLVRTGNGARTAAMPIAAGVPVYDDLAAVADALLAGTL